ncbi:hypothetical protein [Massilia brevitalea]|uniref:hypothetical protein n=1 Tax=Massilia brevitalea TaxID=442526 RepID=UPI0027391CB7|nr:hypothetical protein [Massilia brevitalea]
MSQIRTFLTGAATMAAALAAIVTLTGAKLPGQHASFDEITVGRINIVEPDGTKRIILSNKAQFPGDFLQGKEGARPDRRDVAGMLFINEEGTENGGLIQKGSIGATARSPPACRSPSTASARTRPCSSSTTTAPATR